MNLDRALSSIARRRPPRTAERMLAAVASPWAAVVEGLVLALAQRSAGRRAAPVALAAPAALGVGNVLKRMVSRPRPGLSRFERNGRRSFPSTHVAGPVALLSCSFCLGSRTWSKRAALGLATAAALAVAHERIAAGKHWPSDVVAGAALGALMGAALGLACAPRREAAAGVCGDALRGPAA
jgi:undecaprenyl-diphosphatase